MQDLTGFENLSGLIKFQAMKLLTVLFFCVLFSIRPVNAQDTIVKKDGTKIVSIVKTIEENIITYKRFYNLDGPDYIITKNSVSRIIFKNGTSEDFNGELYTGKKELSDSTNNTGMLTYKYKVGGDKILLNGKKLNFDEVVSLYSDMPEALKSYKTGTALTTTGNIIGIPSGLLMIGYFAREVYLMISTRDDPKGYPQSNKNIYIIGGIGTATGLILAGFGRGLRQKSVTIHNDYIKNSDAAINLNMEFYGSGVRLCLKF